MTRKKAYYYFILIVFIICLFRVSPVKAQMIKEVVFGLFLDAPSEVEADRFYMRYHAPEAIRNSGQRLRKYVMYRPYDPPEEAVQRFGAVKGRYAELWFASEEEYHSRPGQAEWTLPSWETDKTRKIPKGGKYPNTVPAQPTEEFYDLDPNPEQTPIIRWIQTIRYPEGVSVEEGEKWFLEVHSKEALKQPGLLKFISYKCLERGGGPPGGRGAASAPQGEPPSSGMMSPPGQMPSEGDMPGSWVRVNEYWYKDFEAWRKAVIELPPEYTVPPWGGEYPFVEIGSTFIGYMPSVDFLKGDYVVP
jgi:hypothetical protein